MEDGADIMHSVISIGIPEIIKDFHSSRIPVTLGVSLYGKPGYSGCALE